MGNPRKRAVAVDAIRGFSLLGILMANMLIFQYGMFGKDEMWLFKPSSLDLIGHDMLKIFVEGSFMPIFTFLFGYSMIKMKESMNAKGLKYGRNVVRRSILLIALGFAHSMLWDGDILLFYGGISFFLLLFVNRKPKTLMIWGIIFLLLSIGISYGGTSAASPEDVMRMETHVRETINLYGTGTYSEIMNHRNTSDPLGLPGGMMFFILLLTPLILGALFLFGMAAAKRGKFISPEQEKGSYLRYAIMFVPFGIAAKTASIMLGSSHAWSGILHMAGAQILALGYIYLFAYIYALSSNRNVVFRSFEAVGRMSLTNYLMQTVICTTIFYGYGLGMFGRLGVLTGILIALGIYIAQAMCSLLYLNRFRTGPIEFLLRIGTYWSWSGQAKPKKPKSPPIQTEASSS
ncbi:uncharacterized protein SAMN05661091_0190 [Paenibacillus uliginis N3/975]|uniref:DUF418 domain-containing protein n=1 Tax=Paenibacillus uliginis N3/975 TaxID=1313296 RepID=A0A1X7G862_9BACL|nr:DUF418 domain-containing protein [Paenibacillus uliginis]SMF65709.1 uncharacterized protein SAMN05661091_0190 [Paenibacillus uliginis N3/975]